MSLKKNIVFNYVSQIYVLAISMLLLPKLMHVMGAEAYGIVGFFSMLQAWLMLLDLGMSATFSRETARYRGGAIGPEYLLALHQKFNRYFLYLGTAFLIVYSLSSYYLANQWFQARELSPQVLWISVLLIGATVSIRWYSGFHRAVVTGFEELQWLSILNVIVNTLRFAVVFVPLYFNHSPIVFFVYQFFVALFELVIFIHKTRQLVPTTTDNAQTLTDKEYMKSVMRFSLTIAFTASLWVAISQIDKLLLSKLLLLSDYGYYSLAVQLAGGLMLIAGPISSAIIPRMSKLEAEHNHQELIFVYRTATRLIAAIVGSVAFVLVFHTDLVLRLWTANETMVNKATAYVVYYSLGYFLLAVSAFPYYLQYAKGDMKLHVWGNVLFLVLLVPSLIYAVKYFGGVGAGYVWLGVNLFYFMIWVPIVHQRFDKTLNAKWFLHDVVLAALPSIVICYASAQWLQAPSNQLLQVLYIGFVFILSLASSLLLSRQTRQMIFHQIKRLNFGRVSKNI